MDRAGCPHLVQVVVQQQQLALHEAARCQPQEPLDVKDIELKIIQAALLQHAVDALFASEYHSTSCCTSLLTL